MTKPGHRRFGLFAHITWHTWRRQRVVRHDDVPIITRSILDAAARNSVHVLAQAVMADHVHVLVSFRPDQTLTPFIRDAKSESSRRVNATKPDRMVWARGYYAGSLSHTHLAAARMYIARQRAKHSDLVPPRVDRPHGRAPGLTNSDSPKALA